LRRRSQTTPAPSAACIDSRVHEGWHVLLPGPNVQILPIATRLTIRAVRKQVVARWVRLARTDEDVGRVPRVGRDLPAQIRSAPVPGLRLDRRHCPQRLEPLRGRRIATVI